MKRLKFWMLSASVMGMFAFASCGNDTPDAPDGTQDDKSGVEVTPPEDKPGENELPAPKEYTALKLTASQEAAKEANNDFAVAMMKDVMEMQNGESTVISPFSLYTVLSMVANGDNGETRDEMLRALGFEPGQAGLDKLNDFNSMLMTQLPQLDSWAYALVSNSMWVGNNMQLLPTFTSLLDKWYAAEAYSLPTLCNENARNLINAWCSEKTKGLIPEFLKENLVATLAIINATYFKGIWSEGFEKNNTKKANFTNLDGTTSEVDMMKNIMEQTKYVKTADAEIVGIPYGNGNFRMVCILPSQGSDVNTYAGRMTAALLKDNIAKMETTKCRLRMPKFDVSSNQDITGLLAKKGLARMFSAGFNAISMSGQPLPMSMILQEARVSTDEFGTVGAATTIATWVGLDPDAEVKEPVAVTLDRPFLFLIEETSTGTILFMGAVTKL